MIKDITYKRLLELIKYIPVNVVIFWSPTSDVSIQMNELLEKQFIPKIKLNRKITINSVNVDKNKTFVEGLNITQIPCIMIFFNGELLQIQRKTDPTKKVDRFVGLDENYPNMIWDIVQFLQHSNS